MDGTGNKKTVVQSRKIMIEEASPGMVLADDVRNEAGGIILSADTILSKKTILKLMDMGVYSLYVEKPPREKAFDIFTGRKAIVVDDSLFFRHMLAKMLYRMGFFVCEELEAADNIVSCNRHCKPDLIMMDIHLPGISGIEGIKRALSAHSEVKIIAVSTDHSQQTVVEALKAGASDFIVKPIDWERVRERIMKVFNAPACPACNGTVN